MTARLQRYWWAGPLLLGCYSMYPYYSEMPYTFAVFEMLTFVYGIYPWLLGHPIRLFGSIPMLLALVMWQRGWQPNLSTGVEIGGGNND